MVPADPPLIKDRDFVYREVTQQLPGGVWVIYGQSLPPEEAAAVPGVPHFPAVIRGEIGASGWVIVPVEGGAASSVTYVSLTDLKVRNSLGDGHAAPSRGAAVPCLILRMLTMLS